MKTIYINCKTNYGTETIDEFTQGENAPKKMRDFGKYVNDMIKEYRITGQQVYKSQRCTKDWRNN